MVGRDNELSAARYATALVKSGAPAQPIIFTGLRGMGNTALLRRCVQDARANGGIVIYAEASDTEPLSETLRRGLERAKKDVESLPKRLKATVDAVIKTIPRASVALPGDMGTVELSSRQPDDSTSAFIDILEELNSAVRRHGRFLVFAIDEIQDAPVPDLRHLVRFIHETAGGDTPAYLVGAGLPDSPEHLHRVRTYTERWRYFRIGLLTRDQTMDAIAIPTRDRQVAIEARALERLAEEAAGYPFFIQEYGSAAWLQHNGNAIATADVESAIPGVRRILEDEFYDARFRKLTPREAAYTLAMAALGPGPHSTGEIARRLSSDSARVASIRNQLIKKDVVYAPSAGMLEFRIPLTERFIEQNRPSLERRAGEKTFRQ
ncbi:MAG TPA: ATP-binding protein [Candidatus Elarobacter sp.]|nr:ATP-binding protein [Candidatus Elarobacter sp.]